MSSAFLHVLEVYVEHPSRVGEQPLERQGQGQSLDIEIVSWEQVQQQKQEKKGKGSFQTQLRETCLNNEEENTWGH